MTPTKPEGLKACPFCGGAGAIESQPSYSQAANTYERHRVWCDTCGFGLDWHNHEADAIAAWNARASPTPTKAATAEGQGGTLYREIDALGGAARDDHDRGYNKAISHVLEVLSRRGFSEQADATLPHHGARA